MLTRLLTPSRSFAGPCRPHRLPGGTRRFWVYLVFDKRVPVDRIVDRDHFYDVPVDRIVEVPVERIVSGSAFASRCSAIPLRTLTSSNCHDRCQR
eukprot:1300212-Rhodomonas_salina.2